MCLFGVSTATPLRLRSTADGLAQSRMVQDSPRVTVRLVLCLDPGVTERRGEQIIRSFLNASTKHLAAILMSSGKDVLRLEDSSLSINVALCVLCSRLGEHTTSLLAESIDALIWSSCNSLIATLRRMPLRSTSDR